MLCWIESCEGESYSLKMCSKHYRRYQRHGSPFISNGHTVEDISGYAIQEKADLVSAAMKNHSRYLAGYGQTTKLINAPAICMMCEHVSDHLDKHHIDYNFPYMVLWFCKSCHRTVHQSIEAERPKL